jgi:hypothetical protein
MRGRGNPAVVKKLVISQAVLPKPEPKRRTLEPAICLTIFAVVLLEREMITQLEMLPSFFLGHWREGNRCSDKRSDMSHGSCDQENLCGEHQ